jgi:hypothetical protein
MLVRHDQISRKCDHEEAAGKRVLPRWARSWTSHHARVDGTNGRGKTKREVVGGVKQRSNNNQVGEGPCDCRLAIVTAGWLCVQALPE